TDATTPTTSTPGPCDARDSGTSAATAISPTITTGMFIRNTHPHQACESSQPPRIGPIGNDRKLADDHTPTALRRSSSENSTVSADSAITTTPPPPHPPSPRPPL